MRSMEPIGLLGGTFDPIHNGHLRVALEVSEMLSLEEVRIIPVNIPSHRTRPKASVLDRCEMISSVQSYPLMLDDVEIRRGGISYTIETLEYFRRKSINRPLYLILGEDAFKTLISWYRASELFSLSNIVVVSRKELIKESLTNTYTSLGGEHTKDPNDLRDSIGFVYFLNIPILQISSSEIREKIKVGKSIRGLVPGQVERIILERKLYKNG